MSKTLNAINNMQLFPKRRILMVIRRLGMGGIEKATLTLANELARQGHLVHVLVLKGEAGIYSESDIKIHCRDLERESRKTLIGMFYYGLSRIVLKPLLPGSGFIWTGIGMNRYFSHFLKTLEANIGRFDLILLRGQGAFELLWQFNDSRCWQVVEGGTRKLLRYSLKKWLLRKLYAKKQVVCVSKGIANNLQSMLKKYHAHLRDLRIIHNGVSLDHIRQMSREQVSPHFNSPYLVHVARLVPVKRQTLLIEAYSYARKSGLDIPLVIIGDGSERERLQALVRKLGLEREVHFLGQQPNPYPWVAHAIAFLLSSRTEGLGLVLIEALALGTQCVAVDAPGGIREVLIQEQQRLLAKPTVENLASKIHEAVNNPVEVVPSWAERFDKTRIAHQFLALIPDHEKTS